MSFDLSVLELAPIGAGMSSSEALQGAMTAARRADALGFKRIWFAEHHGLASVASAAPEVLIASAAAITTRIRVGSGGVMLPNHAPYLVAERFSILEALHPGRIDLGLGRAPGSDQRTMRALRRTPYAGDRFPDDVQELLGYLRGDPAQLAIVPRAETMPEPWILGSSGFGAELAGRLGLGCALAHHFSPGPTMPSVALYREAFQAAGHTHAPRLMVTCGVICAETHEEARELALSFALVVSRMRSGKLGPVPTPDEARAHRWTEQERADVEAFMAGYVIGDPDEVKQGLVALAAATGADELMLSTTTHSLASRLRSAALVAEVFGLPGAAPQPSLGTQARPATLS